MKMRQKIKTTTAFTLIMILLISFMIFPGFSYGNNTKYFTVIKTFNDKYFCAEDGGGNIVNATRDKSGEWETFEIIVLKKGTIALRSNNGDYLRVSKDGSSVYADSDKIRKRETFEVKVLKDNKVAFKTYDDKYISAENGGGDKVTANMDKIGTWESFELIKADQPKLDKSVLTAKPVDKGITFTWTKPTNSRNIIGYNLYRGTTSGKQSSTPITDFPIEATSYTDYNIKDNTTYYYTLRVVYKDNVLGTASNEVSTKLNTIVNLKAQASEGGVYLYWDKPTDSKNIIGYYLYRSTRSGRQTTSPITDFPVDGTFYLDKNIKDDITYYYTMKPVYRDNLLGVESNEVSIKSVTKTANIVLQVGSQYMHVNSIRKEIDPGKGTNVIIKNGRTFLPIRAVIEAMGGEVDWRESDKRVSIDLNNRVIQLWIGENIARVNNVNKETDVAPYISTTGRTMLPLRFIAENLDCEVNWDGLTKKVTITTTKR